MPFPRWAVHRIDEVMAAHLQEAAIVETVLADEDRIHRGLHVVVDAASAGPLEQREGPVVSIEHHLLRLARIDAHEQHAAVAKPDMGDLPRSPSRRSAERLPGSNRTGRLPPAQSSVEHRPQPSPAHAAWPSAWRSGAAHRSRRHSRARAAPRRSGSASTAREQAWPHCLPALHRVQSSSAPASAAVGRSARTRMMSPPTVIPCGRAPAGHRLQRGRRCAHRAHRSTRAVQVPA